MARKTKTCGSRFQQSLAKVDREARQGQSAPMVALDPVDRGEVRERYTAALVFSGSARRSATHGGCERARSELSRAVKNLRKAKKLKKELSR